MADEIDPEIAALIGGVEEYSPKSGASLGARPAASAPSFDSLFGDLSVTGELEAKGEFEVDFSKKAYEPIAQYEQEPPTAFFEDPQYYQKALAGEGEPSQRFHEILKKYLQATDPKDRGLYRQQLITSYWNMAPKLAAKALGSAPVMPKLLLLRYGMALPTMITPEQRSIFSRIVHKKIPKETVYYMDEWLKAVALGQITQSSTDEVRSAPSDERARFNNLLQKAMGKRDTAEAFLKSKAEERRALEGMLKDRVALVCEHTGMPGFLHIPSTYTESQKKTVNELAEILRKLLAADRELSNSVEAFDEAAKDVQSLKEKMGGLPEETKANLQALAQEFDTVRQMLKMCVGRQGNHFPLLAKEYFHLSLREVGTRENVIDALAWIESIDSQAYCRPYKSSLNRIEPYVILLPCYGDLGVCWEPFDKFNRHSSRSRIAVPMYPKTLRVAVATAVADMRWQAAKEKASYYWMEEGLTGQYYQWFTKQKLKGDVKEYFIQDYITWITKESEGIQKLDKEVRGIFWRLMPFQQPIKDKLRDRSFVYQELYQRDINRSLSDGY
jgi:hypothetical protein